ncbi:MAG: hypothetical protein N3C59_05070 [Azovibrio sp.]|nr:hypothetical protein [Azovibrio sp.]
MGWRENPFEAAKGETLRRGAAETYAVDRQGRAPSGYPGAQWVM